MFRRLRPSSSPGFNRPLALLVAGSLFMENLDGTILQTAAPAVAADFGITPSSVGVTMVTYLLAVAVAVPASGWIADRYGTRRVFLCALAGFTATSLLCALAPNLLWLCIFRTVQGLAGALMVPIGRLAVLRAIRPTALLAAMAYLTWPSLVAPVVAPFLGGLLADTVGWRWIFGVNIPIGIALAVVGLAVVPRIDPPERIPLDWRGFALVSGAVVCLTGGVELMAGGRWPIVVALLTASSALGVAAVRAMTRRDHPLFDLDVLRIKTFRAGNLSGSVYRLMITAAPFLFALLLQSGFGWSAASAGAIITAVFVGNLAIKPLTTPIIRRLGFRRTLVWSNVAGAIALGAFVFVTPSVPVTVIVGLMLASGVFRSIGFSAYNTVQFADVGERDLVAANTLSSTLQQIATALGIAVASLAVRIGVAIAGPDGDLAYRLAFAVAAAVMSIPLFGALRLSPDAGAHAARR
ncbi:MFS transporter [Gordonia sp. TBRC 11910]|uniref:MFS transporter n=1 Tax=Gordonia asplenii TaxID=2725283 RepID=A0A848L1E3_9ACTN|nr:MFS transporter [Gordonia asplenii]NMO02433.1 MFS transporter [Gordonia asplenii]